MLNFRYYDASCSSFTVSLPSKLLDCDTPCCLDLREGTSFHRVSTSQHPLPPRPDTHCLRVRTPTPQLQVRACASLACVGDTSALLCCVWILQVLKMSHQILRFLPEKSTEWRGLGRPRQRGHLLKSNFFLLSYPSFLFGYELHSFCGMMEQDSTYFPHCMISASFIELNF